ncbi:MAG: primosomal protein N' [Firmicutes bacterium]|nr:primosomal protein N' [Bacillota bacterium]
MQKQLLYAEVIVDIAVSDVDRIFDYSTVNTPNVAVGMRVLVPFGNREIEGYVIALKENSLLDSKKIKPISKLLDAMPVFSSEMLALKDYLVKTLRIKSVNALRLFIPSQMRKGRIKELTKAFISINPEYIGMPTEQFIKPPALAQLELFEYLLQNGETMQSELTQNFSASSLKNLIMRGIVLQNEHSVRRIPYKDIAKENEKHILTLEQEVALNTIQSNQGNKFLIHGVTGSGKTEVYMRVIASALEQGKTAIMLVPEIALTPQVFKNFRARFGDKVALLHSGLSAGERFDEWRRLISGEALVAVGARSAIFAPLQNIGAIIIDEEHDSSYNADSNPRYKAHEVAQFRAEFNNASLILGSATPSIESYYKTKTGEFNLIELNERVNKKPLPEIELVDMCAELFEGNNSFFSRSLKANLAECLENGNQAMLFINRRGYASYLICRSCGHVPKCASCEVSLVYHREDNALKCHFCSARYAKLDLCSECKSESIKSGHVGTERVVEELNKIFPSVRVLRMDNDTTRTKDAHANILEAFSKGEAQVLVGTQMIAKGHDFPSVTLVGILDADLSLYFADYRAIERTYSLITQVSGRAGRDEKAGKVVMQSYTPKHYVYKYAIENDYKGFFEKELNLREASKYPPFAKFIRILLSGEVEDLTVEVLKKVFDEVAIISKEYPNQFVYLSAMRSPVKRIQNKYRMQVLCRLVGDIEEISQKLFDIIEKYQNPKLNIFIEFNPNNLG